MIYNHYLACLYTQCLIQKIHYQGLRSSKNVSLHFVNDHFESKRNADSGLYGQTRFNQLQNNMQYHPSIRITRASSMH